ncbi:MAG: 3-deoxy-D-manno-octulosonic acid transferase, partial [Chitinophagaceae bacterium]|nr:3-deoxy-D-manno-octulosonic acid transferase [Chitinophagaceae bacterium]
MILYQFFLRLYPILAYLISPFNEKAKQWVDGQAKVWDEINALSPKIKQPLIWVHCASYGEYEQGLPIIDSLKLKYSSHQIWLTFFSPSGYVYRKKDAHADFVTYLPFDNKKNASLFLETIKPSLIIFIKYEFWFNYLSIAKEKNIPTILASALFRKGQIFFKFYGGFYRKILNLFSAILVQDKESEDLIKPIISASKIFITGDTRFDRVITTASTVTKFEWIQKLSNYKVIIAGSTWESDHLILAKTTLAFKKLNWIIVPHHVNAASIAECKSHFPKAITLTELLASKQHFTLPTIIIIDQIGILRSIYQYAYISYVGGGFGKDGVHNVLEPAAFGKPVIWGSNDSKYREAIGLRNAGGGFSIQNAEALIEQIQLLIESEKDYSNTCSSSAQYIIDNAGATHK